MANPTPIRWGILGAANFALGAMAPAIHAARGAELVAVASSAAAKVAPFQAFSPATRYVESYEALLADPGIDAVYIPLPNHLHVEWAGKALRAGKHVLCEKPIAMKAAEIDDLIALRDETGKLISEAFMIVHHPQWARVRALLQDGAIGELRHVSAEFTYMNDDMGDIRNRPETGGGGLRDVGVYTFGSVRHATGAEPIRLAHTKAETVNGVDTYSYNVFDFDGFSLSSLVSTRMGRRQSLRFHGADGEIALPSPFNPGLFAQSEVHLIRPDKTVLSERFNGMDQYVLQVEAFGAAIRGQAEWPWPLEKAKGTQAMIDDAIASLDAAVSGT
ncbi:Gfo/Idh/MocA family protein [Pseudooceanicola algae]|uniref:dTDP-3,4-didehydro-2,6-dideoxy-alpha-D-glucose 3-reductase n=1 Tax=Pseudooceanicola algae TaxID=1537215 RepID=A0A418SCF7_9RHOB|nr:Gfo/Idh/MocA family oxidoreductase [Pseudooceanicola algae]QPM90059.1 dTDP-3,4-didehydro-2,6-dideoxy-alpha-D-glucose 3-reductase [Pseudooceanicola algae]